MAYPLRDPRHPASTVRNRMYRGEARGSHQFRLDVGARDGRPRSTCFRRAQPDLMGAQLSRDAAVHHDHRRNRRRLDDRSSENPHRSDSQALVLRLAGWAVFILISILWIAPLKESKTGCRVRSMDLGSFRAKRFRVSAARSTMRAAPTRTSSHRHSSAFQANRREMIRFPETYGVLREAELEYRARWVRARRALILDSENFFKLIVDDRALLARPDHQIDSGWKAERDSSRLADSVTAAGASAGVASRGFSQAAARQSDSVQLFQTDDFILWQRKPSTAHSGK